jgi:hypothetical protein
MIYFGSGICSYNLIKDGAIFNVTVPIIKIRSACRSWYQSITIKVNCEPINEANSIKRKSEELIHFGLLCKLYDLVESLGLSYSPPILLERSPPSRAGGVIIAPGLSPIQRKMISP